MEFTSAEDGSGVVLIPGENGELDFAVLEGKYIVTVTNDNGEELMVLRGNAGERTNLPSRANLPNRPITRTEPDTTERRA